MTIFPEARGVRVSDTEGHVLLEDVLDAATSPSRVVRSTPSDEVFLGLGERTGRLDRRGRRFVLRGTDAYDTRYGGYGPDADPLYQSIPFFVGIREACRSCARSRSSASSARSGASRTRRCWARSCSSRRSRRRARARAR